MQVNALKNNLTNKVRDDIYWLYQWCRETELAFMDLKSRQ